MYIWENEDGTYRIEDNYYRYFFEEKYEAYLEKQMGETIENIAEVRAIISNVKGKEYDSNMTVDDVVSGRLEISPLISVIIAAKDMTEKECEANNNVLEKMIEEMDMYGAYTFYYVNMEKEDVIPDQKFDEITYRYMINWFGKKGETSG